MQTVRCGVNVILDINSQSCVWATSWDQEYICKCLEMASLEITTYYPQIMTAVGVPF